MNMKRKTPEPDLPAAYRRLQARLSQIGWVALGSLVERNQPGQGGPRYQWSRRVGPKTVTVALSAEQFAWLKEALAHQRQAWEILTKMQQLTLRQLWKLPGTTRRKQLSKKTLESLSFRTCCWQIKFSNRDSLADIRIQSALESGECDMKDRVF